MKKLNIILLLVFVLTGCSTTRIYQEPSSKCKYEVTGLSCKNEMIYQPENAFGQKVKKNHTMFWFTDQELCEEMVKDPKNRELFSTYGEMPAVDCGNSRNMTNFYVYSDGERDGEFYYIITSPLMVKYAERDHEHPYGYEEAFKAIFTSKAALQLFQHSYKDHVTTLYGYSLNHAERTRVKRFD